MRRKMVSFFTFFPNTLRLDEIKYAVTLHPHAILFRDTWPKSDEWQISESEEKFDF